LLRELFGLTAAEAEVARALAGGATKAEVAGARGLRETTVRTQVRSVLAKTGAANLRDLERMLAGLVGL
ncbi:LuxR C-terminal-related transcriptional regulator, partial [Falsiroseomonas oryzae]|uniref:LuxR C-terminal-related transcriptional regulator n=1 Tax=Falsiroseomonas oryzae TaxID=2766473 RepID=UPI0022EB5724